MAQKTTLKTVLDKAIQKEIEAQELYLRLSRMVVEDSARDMFLELLKVEKKHENLLRKYARGELQEGALKSDHVLDYKIAECLDQPPITPDMKLGDVLLLAANREKASHEFYTSLAAEHPPGEIKKLLEELASQELEHKHRVEDLYTEVAFPQTAGG
jgi:rubrerythrin